MVQIFSVDQPMNPGESSADALLTRVEGYENAQVVDRWLVGYSSTWPHNHSYAPFILGRTSHTSLIVAHRPGVMDPVAAARYFATLDVISGGRLAINIVTGGSDRDLHREGDYQDNKSERYERATEYLDVMRAAWTTQGPFDHIGKFFKEEGVNLAVKPVQGSVPIFMGGDSPEGTDFGARHADLYMLRGEPLAATQERIDQVNLAAQKYGRTVDYSISLRIFVAETDELAWEKAHAAEAIVVEDLQAERSKILRSSKSDKSVGRARQLEFAEQELHDDCFWTRLVTLLGGLPNSAALVGTPERVIASLRKYRELGIESFLFTSGADGLWHDDLTDFIARVKQEL